MGHKPSREILERVMQHKDIDFYQQMPNFQMGSSIQQKAEIHADNDMSRIGVETASSPGQPLPHVEQAIQQAVADHARADMENIGPDVVDRPEPPSPTGKPSIGERFAAWVADNHAKQPSLLGQAKAIAIEALNDIRQTLHESFFGKPEHPSGAGTPMSPTIQEVHEDLHQSQPSRSSAFEPSARPGPAPEQSRGISR